MFIIAHSPRLSFAVTLLQLPSARFPFFYLPRLWFMDYCIKFLCDPLLSKCADLAIISEWLEISWEKIIHKFAFWLTLQFPQRQRIVQCFGNIAVIQGLIQQLACSLWKVWNQPPELNIMTSLELSLNVYRTFFHWKLNYHLLKRFKPKLRICGCCN